MLPLIMLLIVIAFMMANLILNVTVSDTRYFEFTTLDAVVTNKALGGTTLAPYIVPPGMNYITAFTPQYSSPGSATGASGAIASLGGDGLANVRTPIELPMGVFGATLNTTHSTPSRAGYIPTNIPCVEGAEIDATASMIGGADTGDGVATLELQFSSIARPNMPQMTTYKALEVLVASVDTWTALEQGAAAKTFKPAVKDKLLRQLITAVVGDTADVGAAGTAVRFSGTGMDQDQIWTTDGSGGTHATEGNGHAEARVRDVMALIEGNQPITGEVIVNGADTGNTLFVVGCGFAEA